MDRSLPSTLRMGWPSAIISPTKGPCLSQLQPDVSNYIELEKPLLTKAGVYLAFVDSWANPLVMQPSDSLSGGTVFTLIFRLTQKHSPDKAGECVALLCKGMPPLLISFNYYLYSAFVFRSKSNILN